MNLFELSAVASPVMGGAGGCIAGASFGARAAVAGACLGFGVGVLVYFGSIGLSAVIMRMFVVRGGSQDAGRLEELASLMALSMPVISPLGSWFLGDILIRKIFGQ